MILLRGMTILMDVGDYAVGVIVLSGIALAVAYSLLMVNRFREERADGGPNDAISLVARIVAAGGRTITFSALTAADTDGRRGHRGWGSGGAMVLEGCRCLLKCTTIDSPR